MKRKLLSIFIALVLALSLCLVTAVPVAAAIAEVWVDDDADPGWYDGTHLHTIQEGITAVDPGGTVNVAAGTYNENVVILGDKDDLQLIGAGSGVTTIAPASGRPMALQGYPLNRPIDGVKIQGFTLVTVDANYALIALSSTPDNFPYTTNLKLEDIVVNGGTYGIGLNAVNEVTLTNVHLSNIRGGGQGALEMTGVSNLTFTNGSIRNNAIGVRLQPTGTGDIGAGYGPNGNILIHNSYLAGNTIAIENQDKDTLIDATNNWWGTTDRDAIAAMVTGDVTFEPWLTVPWGSKAAILKGSGVPGKGLDTAPGQQKPFNPKSQAAEHAGKKVK